MPGQCKRSRVGPSSDQQTALDPQLLVTEGFSGHWVLGMEKMVHDVFP